LPAAYADNVALPAFAPRTPLQQQAIDISCLPGPQQQTFSSGLLLCAHAGTQTDGQTGGQTPYRLLDPFPHTTRAAPIMYFRCVDDVMFDNIVATLAAYGQTRYDTPSGKENYGKT